MGLHQGRSALPCVGVHRGYHRLACRRAFTVPVARADVRSTIWHVARSKTHLAPARFGTTERLLQGFPKIRPSIDITAGVHSQRSSGFPSLHLRRAVANDPLVPSSWALTTSTAFSTDSSWACCIPQPILGFIGFQPRAAPSQWRASRGIPADAIPFRAFPTRKAAPAFLQAVALMSFRAAFLGPPGLFDFKALLRASVRCRSLPLPVDHARCSLGLPCLWSVASSSHHAEHRPRSATALPCSPLGESASVHGLESPACGAARRRNRARPMPATMEGWDFLPLHNRRTGRGQAQGALADGTHCWGRRAARRMMRSCLCRETKTSARPRPRRAERTAACVKSRRKAVLGRAPRPLPAPNPSRGQRTLRR